MAWDNNWSMAYGISARRWLWLLLGTALACLLVGGAVFLMQSPREFDRTDAARALVAWVVEGRSVPGSGLPNTKRPEKERYFVVCDILPAEISLSHDPRVHRVTAEEEKAAFQKHEFNSTVYMTISLKSETFGEIVLDFTPLYGPKGGSIEEYTFQRKGWELRCKRKMLEVL